MHGPDAHFDRAALLIERSGSRLTTTDHPDVRAGLALERLRDALVAQSGPGMLCFDVTDELGRWHVAAYHSDNVDGGDEGEGDTFAEACDATRAALEPMP
jgi:hypothetical protein